MLVSGLSRVWVFLFGSGHRGGGRPDGHRLFNREKERRAGALLRGCRQGLVEAGMYQPHRVLDQISASHRNVLLKDEGAYTRHNDRWPLQAVQFLASGPQTPPQG
jgi:hypothetical protein